MVEQMKKDIAPICGMVYGEYTEDRDRLVNYVVDQAMKKLPDDLPAEVIFKNKTSILGDFRALSSKHSAAIVDFLETSRGATPNVYKVMWYSKMPVQARVAQQVVGKVPMQYKVMSKERL